MRLFLEAHRGTTSSCTEKLKKSETRSSHCNAR
jgi:hypothetical protein